MLTGTRISQLLRYDPLVGTFIRLSGKGGCSVGSIAGTFDKQGYVRIGIDGVHYRAHRLAWLWMTGAWPEFEIDHIDRNKSNNVWSNLRAATGSENSANRPTTGVWRKKCCNRWESRVKKKGVVLYLGLFTSFEDASIAYRKARAMQFGDYCILKRELEAKT